MEENFENNNSSQQNISQVKKESKTSENPPFQYQGYHYTFKSMLVYNSYFKHDRTT